MRRLVAVLLFLALVNEGDPLTKYSGYMFAPFGWVGPTLMAPIAQVRPFEIGMLLALIVASSTGAGKGPRVAPMRGALLLAVGTLLLWLVYGLATGGNARAAGWQIYLPLSVVLSAFAVAANFHTAEHYAILARTLVFAALYRAAMTWYFYFAYRATVHLDWVAAHDDTVTWVISIIVLAVHAMGAQNRRTTLRAVVSIAFLLGAIQWNNRRLAWVSLVMALVTAFFLLPKGRARRRVAGAVRVAIPVILLYAVIGWGRPGAIFSPLRSFATVSTQEDQSTKARNCENLGLIATVDASTSIAGTGWGHKYVELSDKYSIAEMELWPYIPHNGILGLLAYTGILGFIGYWLQFPTAMFFNARVAQLGNTSELRNVGLVGAVAMAVCSNQMYGDMGLFSPRTMYVISVTYAMALRLPIAAGVWDAPRPARVQPA